MRQIGIMGILIYLYGGGIVLTFWSKKKCCLIPNITSMLCGWLDHSSLWSKTKLWLSKWKRWCIIFPTEKFSHFFKVNTFLVLPYIQFTQPRIKKFSYPIKFNRQYHIRKCQTRIFMYYFSRTKQNVYFCVCYENITATKNRLLHLDRCQYVHCTAVHCGKKRFLMRQVSGSFLVHFHENIFQWKKNNQNIFWVYTLRNKVQKCLER